MVSLRLFALSFSQNLNKAVSFLLLQPTIEGVPGTLALYTNVISSLPFKLGVPVKSGTLFRLMN